MRIGIAGIFHETNTFAPGQTGIDGFQAEWFVGKEAFERNYRGTRTGMGGAIDAGEQLGFEAVPLFYAEANPSSMVTGEAVETLLGELVSHVEREAAGLDGLLLILHGAMAGLGFEDVEGELLKRVRPVFQGKPIAVTLDLHANISPDMVGLSDIITCFDTYPHIDAYERAVEAGELLVRQIKGEVKPVQYLAKTDILIAPPMMNTNISPMKELMEKAFAMEKEAGVLNITVAGGFAFADVFCAGMNFVVTTDGDAVQAERIGRELADWVKDNRQRFAPVLKTVEEAYAEVTASGQYPAVLVESSDNVGGGSPADATHTFKYLAEKPDTSFLIVVCDPEAVREAERIGVAGRFAGEIGGKTDRHYGHQPLHGEPVAFEGKVRLLFDGHYKHKGPYMTGKHAYLGKTAVIESDHGGRSVVLLTEEREAPWDINHVRCVGIDPEDFDIIVVKAAVAWRTAFGPIAKQVVELDTPGCCSSNLSHFTYRNIPDNVDVISGGRKQ